MSTNNNIMLGFEELTKIVKKAQSTYRVTKKPAHPDIERLENALNTFSKIEVLHTVPGILKPNGSSRFYIQIGEEYPQISNPLRYNVKIYSLGEKLQEAVIKKGFSGIREYKMILK